MVIRNVLVPIDFSQPSKTALDYGVALARLLRARLTLLHVLEPQPALEVATEADIQSIESARRAEAQQKLDDLVAPEDQDDLNVRTAIRSGPARREIAAAAEAEQPDIVLLGTHGRSRLGRFIMGSTTEGLLRKLHIPVMTVGHVTSPGVVQRILFATDLSGYSKDAFVFALDMAGRLRADILALHVMGKPMLAAEEPGMPMQPNEVAREEVRRRLQMLVAEGKQRGITVQTSIADGEAATQILQAAVENQADLILLPIESKGVVERTLLGTTAERVVREAHVPVLSVPVPVAPREKIAQVS
jgi:nucleotide-binding universal stress UspA family protein